MRYVVKTFMVSRGSMVPVGKVFSTDNLEAACNAVAAWHCPSRAAVIATDTENDNQVVALTVGRRFRP